jgi:hypothetical protein
MQTAALAPPFAIEHLDWDAPVKEWLVFATENAIVIIDALALIIVVGGTVEAFVGGLRAMFSSPTGHDRRDIWLRYARWLSRGSPSSLPPTSSRRRSPSNGKPWRGSGPLR